MTLIIPPETSAEHESIRHVSRLAFAQDDEARLVDALREGSKTVGSGVITEVVE